MTSSASSYIILQYLNVVDKGFKAHLPCHQAGGQQVLQAAIRDTKINHGRLSPEESARQAWIAGGRCINEQAISRCFLFGFLSDGLELNYSMPWADILFTNIVAQTNVTFRSFRPPRYLA